MRQRWHFSLSLSLSRPSLISRVPLTPSSSFRSQAKSSSSKIMFMEKSIIRGVRIVSGGNMKYAVPDLDASRERTGRNRSLTPTFVQSLYAEPNNGCGGTARIKGYPLTDRKVRNKIMNISSRITVVRLEFVFLSTEIRNTHGVPVQNVFIVRSDVSTL